MSLNPTYHGLSVWGLRAQRLAPVLLVLSVIHFHFVWASVSAELRMGHVAGGGFFHLTLIGPWNVVICFSCLSSYLLGLTIREMFNFQCVSSYPGDQSAEIGEFPYNYSLQNDHFKKYRTCKLVCLAWGFTWEQPRSGSSYWTSVSFML